MIDLDLPLCRARRGRMSVAGELGEGLQHPLPFSLTPDPNHSQNITLLQSSRSPQH